MRFPQEFGEVRRDFGDTTKDIWNSMVDITDVLSKFLNITLKPIAKTLEEAQLKRAKSARILPSEMWATSSFESMQKARVGGEAPQENLANTANSKKRKTPDQGARQASAHVATGKGKGKGKGRHDGGKSSRGNSNPKGGSKGGSKGKGDKGKLKGKQPPPTFRPNWQPNGTAEPPKFVNVDKAQKIWPNQCASDKCHREHDGRGCRRTAQKRSLSCFSCCDYLVQKGWQGLWCKDNNQRRHTGGAYLKGQFNPENSPKNSPERRPTRPMSHSMMMLLLYRKVHGWRTPKPKGAGAGSRRSTCTRFSRRRLLQKTPMLVNTWHSRPSVEVEAYQVLQEEATPVGPYAQVQGDCFFSEHDSDDELQVYRTPDDPYFMDMATGRYMDLAMEQGLGQGDGYSSPSTDSLTGGHIHALTAGPNQEPATELDQEPDEIRDQHGYSQRDHDEWNYQMGASRPPPPTLEHNLNWVTGSDGGYPQDKYTVTQQSVGEPSIR